eukprot:2507855-Rhodomonas_salina.3
MLPVSDPGPDGRLRSHVLRFTPGGGSKLADVAEVSEPERSSATPGSMMPLVSSGHGPAGHREMGIGTWPMVRFGACSAVSARLQVKFPPLVV